jgi:hypothetical protein
MSFPSGDHDETSICYLGFTLYQLSDILRDLWIIIEHFPIMTGKQHLDIAIDLIAQLRIAP